MSGDPECRLCGETLTVGLLATGRSTGCLNPTRITGHCPNHGPLGPHHVRERED